MELRGSEVMIVVFLFLFYFICHYLIIILFYKLQEYIKEIKINGEET